MKGDVVLFLKDKLAAAEKALACREQSVRVWSSGTDKDWRESCSLHPSTAGKSLGKKARSEVAERETAIAAKCRHEVEMFKAAITELSK